MLAEETARADGLQVMLDAANDMIAELDIRVDTAEGIAATATQQVADAQKAQADAQKAQADAEMATADAKKAANEAALALTTAQANLAAANKRAGEAEAEVRRLMAAMEDDEEEQTEDQMRAYMVRRVKSVMSAMDDPDTAPTVKVEWDGNRAKVELDDHSVDSGNAPPAITGWRNVTLARERPAPVSGTDSVYVYTDIHGPQSKKFMEVHGATVSFDPDDNTPGVAKLAMSDDFPVRKAGNVYNHPSNADALEGTYDSVSGELIVIPTVRLRPHR